MGLNCNGWLPALPHILDLGGKTNTVAYYNTSKIIATKTTIVKATGVNP
jgi:hypothetical protein